jgi:fatty acid desaturase
VIAAAMAAVASGWAPWPVVPVLALAIGVAFACLTFIAHEALHGGIVRHRGLRNVVGGIGFSWFFVSPRLWTAWHGRIHHAVANLDSDPDRFPLESEYRTSRRVRVFIDRFALGGRRRRGLLTLLFGFTVQAAMQLIVARRRGFLSARNHRLAIAETAAVVVGWTALAIAVGPLDFLAIFVVPHLVANAIVMAFILTNHSLSPLVEINDPLASGLSVTAPAWVDWLTLRFGFHVEHHLFPAMSSRHAPAVRAAVLARWPERYQSMPLTAALRELYRSSRVYRDASTLIDLRTGETFPTRAPGAPPSAPRGARSSERGTSASSDGIADAP